MATYNIMYQDEKEKVKQILRHGPQAQSLIKSRLRLYAAYEVAISLAKEEEKEEIRCKQMKILSEIRDTQQTDIYFKAMKLCFHLLEDIQGAYEWLQENPNTTTSPSGDPFPYSSSLAITRVEELKNHLEKLWDSESAK